MEATSTAQAHAAHRPKLDATCPNCQAIVAELFSDILCRRHYTCECGTPFVVYCDRSGKPIGTEKWNKVHGL